MPILSTREMLADRKTGGGQGLKKKFILINFSARDFLVPTAFFNHFSTKFCPKSQIFCKKCSLQVVDIQNGKLIRTRRKIFRSSRKWTFAAKTSRRFVRANYCQFVLSFLCKFHIKTSKFRQKIVFSTAIFLGYQLEKAVSKVIGEQLAAQEAAPCTRGSVEDQTTEIFLRLSRCEF